MHANVPAVPVAEQLPVQHWAGVPVVMLVTEQCPLLHSNASPAGVPLPEQQPLQHWAVVPPVQQDRQPSVRQHLFQHY